MKKISLILFSLFIHYLSQGQVTFGTPQGSATSITGGYRMTSTTFESAAIWASTTVNFDQPFTLTFDADINPVSGIGADGFCAVFTSGTPNTAGLATGRLGHRLGYFDDPFYPVPAYPPFDTKSLAVRYDNFYNHPSAGDLASQQDNVSINTNASLTAIAGPVTILSGGGTVQGSGVHSYIIDWTPPNTLTVTVDGSQRLSTTFCPQNIWTTTELQNITWGFTAATGNVASTHDLINIQMPKQTADSPIAICQGSTITLSDGGTSGGTWTSSNSSIASVSSSGVVTGVAPGTAAITYTISSPCVSRAIYIVDVHPTPNAGVISGPDPVCGGSTHAYSTSGTPIGTWSGSGAIASVGATTGMVTFAGVTTATTATITYTTSPPCPVQTATYVVTVMPTAIIAGDPEVCPGTPITLTGTPAGGTWSGGSGSASISDLGGGIGIVTGIMVGTATFTYTIPGGCPATHTVNVHCPCDAFDNILSTLTSSVTYGDGCSYTCTATATTINGWTIAGYLWQMGGSTTWNPSTSTADVQTVTVPFSGTEIVTVTFYAVDSTGDTCTISKTDTLYCEHPPCYDAGGTTLTITSTTDAVGNCVFVATANVSTTHIVLGYEWTITGGSPIVVHTTATSNTQTFTLPPSGSGTISVIVHIVDPYFEAGQSPCCDAVLSEKVVCETPRCLIDSVTLSSTVFPQGDNCFFMVTANAYPGPGTTIVSYDWSASTGASATNVTSATTDTWNVMVPAGTSAVITVTVTAVNAYGDTCTFVKSIRVICGDSKPCDCFKNLPLLSYTATSTANGCKATITAVASMKDPKCKILYYEWLPAGSPSVTIYTSAPSSSQTFTLPSGTWVTVTIAAMSPGGDTCKTTDSIRITCDNPPIYDCCFDSTGTYLTHVDATAAGMNCIYTIYPHMLIDPNCTFLGYIYQSTGNPSTGLTLATSYTVPTVTVGHITNVTVTYVALKPNGDTCTVVRTLQLFCTDELCCFSDMSTHFEVTGSTTDTNGDCLFDLLAHGDLWEGNCTFLGFIYETPTWSSGLVTSSTYTLPPVPAGTSVAVSVTFLAVKSNGDTCRWIKFDTLRCPVSPIGTGGGPGVGTSPRPSGMGTPEAMAVKQVSNPDNISIFPNPANNAVTISSTMQNIGHVQVIDVNGKTVGEYHFKNTKMAEVSMEKLVPGTYLLKVNGSMSKVVTKL